MGAIRESPLLLHRFNLPTHYSLLLHQFTPQYPHTIALGNALPRKKMAQKERLKSSLMILTLTCGYKFALSSSKFRRKARTSRCLNFDYASVLLGLFHSNIFLLKKKQAIRQLETGVL